MEASPSRAPSFASSQQSGDKPSPRGSLANINEASTSSAPLTPPQRLNGPRGAQHASHSKQTLCGEDLLWLDCAFWFFRQDAAHSLGLTAALLRPVRGALVERFTALLYDSNMLRDTVCLVQHQGDTSIKPFSCLEAASSRLHMFGHECT